MSFFWGGKGDEKNDWIITINAVFPAFSLPRSNLVFQMGSSVFSFCFPSHTLKFLREESASKPSLLR